MANSITATYLFWLSITITLITCASSSRFLVGDQQPAIAPYLPNPVATPVADVEAPVSAPVGPTKPSLSFFVHYILGGSNPSAKVMTGIHPNSEVNGQLPFSNTNGVVNPVNCSDDNENYVTFLTGIDGGGEQSGQLLPDGRGLMKLPFGVMTVLDEEMTEGQEIGSSVIGRAQGFYVVSSEDGSCMTMALTTMLGTEKYYTDSLSFFGVHQTAASESHVAIIGGTGKYSNIKGYAVVQTVNTLSDQHMTDGLESIFKFTVYLA